MIAIASISKKLMKRFLEWLNHLPRMSNQWTPLSLVGWRRHIMSKMWTKKNFPRFKIWHQYWYSVLPVIRWYKVYTLKELVSINSLTIVIKNLQKREKLKFSKISPTWWLHQTLNPPNVSCLCHQSWCDYPLHN